MKKTVYTAIALIGIFFLFSGCGEEKVTKEMLPDYPLLIAEKNETDEWIEKNLTIPHNISVVYKWKDSETDLGRNLTPPSIENVIPLLKAIQHIFIDTYVTEGGLDFFNALCPKQFLLVGSYGYNSSGTITLGEAEGGRKISIFGVNFMKEPGRINRVMKTMHHEFGHILHQTKEFSPEYQKISAQHYTSNWSNRTHEEARALGLISNYASANQNEDFVEMLSIFVTTPPGDQPGQWDYICDNILDYGEKRNEAGSRVKLDKENATDVEIARKASNALRQKESMVRSYMKQNWHIELDTLRSLVQSEIEKTLKDFK